jgi:hypothetical protein
MAGGDVSEVIGAKLAAGWRNEPHPLWPVMAPEKVQICGFNFFHFKTACPIYLHDKWRQSHHHWLYRHPPAALTIPATSMKSDPLRDFRKNPYLRWRHTDPRFIPGQTIQFNLV